MIDFSINAVMASDRALLVDVLDTEDQPAGNAWAGAMFAVGSVSGFFLYVYPSPFASSIFSLSSEHNAYAHIEVQPRSTPTSLS
jgi:hypothetical protein